ncbi:Bud-site selection protein [Podospora aff. communis PSN243]|uniref:Bud-site selection protein n=1 Tax=Podospora aff. communis PSN243 TaxID=3040156 RepID=A0AAV9G6G3_9PEZI|nr:Bud-site selection protein [Podospora aff. communis PSN243]
MPKRKREDGVEEVFMRLRNELHHALKAAKGFERQRQSKRLRDPKAAPDKKDRVQKEIVVLKSLDLHQAAHAHLCSALLRIKSIAECPKLPAQIKEGVPKPELTEDERIALHNVTSGLAARQEVRSVIDKAIPAICKVLGITVPEKKGKGKKSEPIDAKGPGEKKKEPKPEKGLTPKSEDSDLEEEERAIAELDDLLNSTSGEESEAEEGEAKKGPVKRAIPKELDPMEITDDEDADSEDDSPEDYPSDLDPMEITDESDASEAEDSSLDSIPDANHGVSDSESFAGFSDVPPSEPESDSESDASSSSSSSASSIHRSPPPKKPKSKSSQASNTEPITGSIMLPSLMGGYISGSESEASDIDVAPPTKHNRRGQRARQAIWEKRYKEKAKHLQKQNEKRDSGWDMKRGAVDGDANKPWKRGIRNPFASDANATDLGVPKKEPVKKRDDTGPLHPSWEAKRKAKEAQSAVPFQGKKITFD